MGVYFSIEVRVTHSTKLCRFLQVVSRAQFKWNGVMQTNVSSYAHIQLVGVSESWGFLQQSQVEI